MGRLIPVRGCFEEGGGKRRLAVLLLVLLGVALLLTERQPEETVWLACLAVWLSVVYCVRTYSTYYYLSLLHEPTTGTRKGRPRIANFKMGAAGCCFLLHTTGLWLGFLLGIHTVKTVHTMAELRIDFIVCVYVLYVLLAACREYIMHMYINLLVYIYIQEYTRINTSTRLLNSYCCVLKLYYK